MPDDDRTRRRLGDETKGRIADLASGWSVPEEPAKERGDDTKARIADLASGWTVDEAPPAPERAPAPRKKAKTLPPPPPGSEARRSLEDAIIGTPRTKPPTAPPPPRATRSTAPPAVPPATRAIPAVPTVPTVRSPSAPVPTVAAHSKSGANAKPPSLVKSGPTETGTVDVSGMIGGMTPAPLLRPPARGGPTATPPSPPPRSAPRTVPPVGRSGSGQVPAIGAPRTATPPVATASLQNSLPLRADTTARTGPSPSMPPPVPPPRPPPPTRTAAADEADEADEIVEPTEVDPGAHLTVPVGEFDHDGFARDHGATQLEQDKLRIAYEQSTMKRDTAGALLGMAEPALTVVKETPVEVLLHESAEHLRGDPTSIDPTAKFERGDPTLGSVDATSIEPPTTHLNAGGGKLRAQAALRRKRGIGGDVRYVATALFGVRRARRELAALEVEQTARQKERARHLLTLGRAAVVTEGYDHPALNRAREQLGDVEDERARHSAQVTAADSELMRVRNDRDFKIKQYQHDIAKLDAELAEVTRKLEPLEKEAEAAGRRASKLHETLRTIDARIAATEASKVAVKGPRLDPAAIQAELASHRADRHAVKREEPVIAAELDALNPRIAALAAARSEARKQKIQLETAEQEDQRRAEELLAAIGAKRKVVDRAAGDAEALRDKILLELGDRIYVDRPTNMTAQLAPVDAIDVELGTTDRRMMELREILSSVDRAKLARGIAVIVLALAAAGSLSWWLIYLFL